MTATMSLEKAHVARRPADTGAAVARSGFGSSYEPERAFSEVHPTTILALTGFVSAVLLVMTLVPPVQRFTGLRHSWELMGLFLLGALADLAMWRFWARRRVRDLAGLLGTTVYCTFVAALMVHTESPARYAFGLLFGQMAADYGRRFAFSWPMLAAVSAMPLLIAVSTWHDFALVVLVAFGIMMYVVTALTTARQRQLLEQKRAWQSAFEAADRVASNSLDAALATTLAEMGAFVHHLRNALTPVAPNLRFLRSVPLDLDSREALDAAQRGAERSCELLDKLIETLKCRAAPSDAHFAPAAVVRQVVDAESGLERSLCVSGELPIFEARGNREHLKVVLENLARNAFEAGAKQVTLSAHLDGGGHALHLAVADDGPGIPEAILERLFKAPVTAGKQAGHGFGLYISRRLIELLGGHLSVRSSGEAGAIFEIVLPGEPVARGETAGNG